jgi:hypothetical protein
MCSDGWWVVGGGWWMVGLEWWVTCAQTCMTANDQDDLDHSRWSVVGDDVHHHRVRMYHVVPWYRHVYVPLSRKPD